jgi:hypothetical protein
MESPGIRASSVISGPSPKHRRLGRAVRFLRPRPAAVAVLVSVLVLILVVVLTGSAAYAVDPLPPDLTGRAGGLAVSTNLLICIGGALVMLMRVKPVSARAKPPARRTRPTPWA